MLEIKQLKSIVGSNVKFFRERNNLTQESLAELSGVSLKTIQRIEGGLAYPKCKTFVALVNIFKIDAMELLATDKSKSVPRERFNVFVEDMNFHNQQMAKLIQSTADHTKDTTVSFNMNHAKRR